MTGKVLLARQPDWRTRQRQTPVAANPPAWQRRERVEFDEPESDHAGGDGGWTVGYLDVLLLLVTLFAALLGATYLQINQLRSAQAAEIQALAALAPPVQGSDTLAALPAIASQDSDAARLSALELAAEPSPDPEPTENVASSSGSEGERTRQTRPEPSAENLAGVIDIAATVASDASTAVIQGVESIDVEPAPTVPQEFVALLGLVDTYAERQGLDILLDRHQLRLEIGDGILFDSGTADLGSPGRALIEELVTALQDDRVKISVEGHTDNVPINTPRFPSNWELSSIRATTVARELIEHGIPQHRIRVTGFADTQPRAPNDSAANRALNRRVSLVLEVSDEVLAGSY